MKKYIAKTSVSVNIVLAGGVNRHIAFTSLTGGGSAYYTDDTDEQKALERHYKYGKLFSLDKDFETKNRTASSPTAQAPATTGEQVIEGAEVTGQEIQSAGDDETETSVKADLKTVVVTDPDSAKTYLAEHFGISRTKLTSIKKIKEAAEANGIVFEGI